MSLSSSRFASKPAFSRRTSPLRPKRDLEARREVAAAIRVSKVARARELLESADYPSEEVIECIARLFARHWHS